MKIRFLAVSVMLFFAISLCGFGIYANAASSDSKIGVINMQKILVESKGGKDARAIFEKEVTGRRETLIRKDNEIKGMDEELKKSASKMKPNVKREKEEKLAAEIKELGRLKQDLEEELKKKDNELTTNILKDVLDIARKLGEERRYELILQASPQIVYADNSVDITDEVIRRYDSQYGKK